MKESDKIKMKKSLIKKLGALLAVIFIVTASGVSSALAYEVPSPNDSFYVLDEANVLSSETEDYIISQNQILCNKNGGQICVVTMKTLNGADIADYAADLFNEWGIGDANKDNGILLLLVTEDESCRCLQGTGLETVMNDAYLTEVLYTYMRDDFLAGDYDKGTMQTFTALYSKLSSIDDSVYGDSDDQLGYIGDSDMYYQGSVNDGNEISCLGCTACSLASCFGYMSFGTIVLFFIVFFLVVKLISLALRPSSRTRRGHRPPPPPPHHHTPRPPHRGFNPPPRNRPFGSNSHRPHTGGGHRGGGSSGGHRGGGFGGGGHRGGGGGTRGGGAGF